MSTEQNRALDNGAATIDALLRMNTSLRAEIKDLEARIELMTGAMQEVYECVTIGLQRLRSDRDLIRRMADCLAEDKAKWSITAYDLVEEAKEATE